MKSAVAGMMALFLTGSVAHSQVHIREKVAISPQKAYATQISFPTGILLLCKSTITVTIEHGYDNLADPNSYMELVLISPTPTTISNDALRSFNRPWTSSELNAGSILKFAIIEHHVCTGLVDTMEVTTYTRQQLSPLDSTFSLKVSGRVSRCNVTQNPGWSELFFNVTINRTIDDIVIEGDGMVHFGLCWWKEDGKPEPAPARLGIRGPCPALLDTVLTGNGGAISGEIYESIAGTYTLNPAISKEASDDVHALYYIGGNLKSGKWIFGNGSKGAADPMQEWCPLVSSKPIPFSTPFSSGFILSLHPSSIPVLHRGDYADIRVDDAFDCSTSRWFRTDPLTLEIVSGSEYASFYVWDQAAEDDKKVGAVATTTAQEISDWINAPYLVIDGDIPDVGGRVVVQALSDGLTSTDSVEVSPPPIAVSVIPTELSPGDTASVVVKERYQDGTVADYPQDQDFEVMIFSGEKYGDILVPDSIGDYFESIKQGFKFVAVDSIDSSAVMVGIAVEPVEGLAGSTTPIGTTRNKQLASGSKSGKRLCGISSLRLHSTTSSRRNRKSVSFIEGRYGIAWVKIKRWEEHAILLGQTKYYYAVDDPDHADKLGVYWEYRDEQGNDLKQIKPGSIRLVGRYWEKEKQYKVGLSATAGTRKGSIVIEVKKPAKLGNNHQKANDVHGTPFNLDSLIIYCGGKYGVMPQYLKAMVSVESMGFFDPCYRYEPYTDIAELQKKDPKTDEPVYEKPEFTHYRVISASDEGSPIIPIDHSNVRNSVGAEMSYPGYTTIWDYYQAHASFYSLTISQMYAPTYEWKAIFSQLAKKLFGKTLEELSRTEQPIVEQATRTEFFEWEKTKFKGGMENMVAQTRLCASYGLLQLMYHRGTEYPQNNGSYLPEAINDYEVGFRYGIMHLIGKFNLRSVLNIRFADPTWQDGLEAEYKRAIGLYNGAGNSYANMVNSQVEKFAPQP